MLKQFLPCLLVLFLILPTKATTGAPSVVFLLDFSGSMAENDPERQGLEGVKQLISSMPPEYQVGIVAYHQDLAIEIPLLGLDSLDTLDFLTDPLGQTEYKGYSHAGLGLSKAMEFLAQGQGEKQIIMLCDGEILLPSPQETQASQALFRQAVAEGVFQGVSLHLLALGDWSLEQSDMREELRYLSGDFYPVEGNFQAIWSALLEDHLQRPLLKLQEHTISPNQVEWDLPLGSLTLLLQSEEPMEGFSLLSEGEILAEGDYFRVISTKEATLSHTIESPSQLNLFAWGQVAVVPEITYHYEDTLLEDGSGYHRQVMGTIHFYTEEGTEPLTHQVYQNCPVTVRAEGTETQYFMEDGELNLPISQIDPQELTFHLEDFPLSVDIAPLSLAPEPAPLLPAEEPSHWRSFVGGAFFGGFLLWMVGKKTSSKPQKTKKEKKSKEKNSPKANYAYVGRLQLELSQGRVDFPVTSYGLFRLPQHRPISLEEILAVCYDLSSVPGTEKIVFRPYKDKMISLTSASSGTIQLEQRLLRKNQTHHLPMGARLDLLLEDGSVLVIIYDLP